MKKLEENYLRYLSGEELGTEELTEIKKWITRDKRARTFLEQLHISRLSDLNNMQPGSIDIDKNLKKITESSADGPDVNLDRLLLLLKKSAVRIRVTAVVLILLLGAVCVIYILRSWHGHSIKQEISVDRIEKISLPDGSLVVLNNGSVLTFPDKMQKRRNEVELQGEAYFNITTREHTSFYVDLSNLILKVKGTSFTLLETEDGNTRVDMHTGAGILYDRENRKNRIRLVEGQTSTFNIRTREFELGTLEEATPYFWDRNEMVFKDQSLAEVFLNLEVVYGKKFNIADSAILNDSIASKYSGQDLGKILKDFSNMFDLQFDIKGDTVFVLRKNL